MAEESRYVFIVRQRFGEEPIVDSFYKIKIPNMDPKGAMVWQGLDPSWCKEEIKSDKDTLFGMGLRLRFNSDMYPKICMVRMDDPGFTAEELESIIQMKYRNNELIDFLKAAEI